MDNIVYDKIKSQWTKYQHPNKSKMPWVTACISKFVGKRVLDIGSNAGVISYEIAEYADKVIGIERNKDYWNQSLKLVSFKPKKLCFLNCDLRQIKDKCRYKFNAAFASCVLYHLKDKDVQALIDFVLPNCDVVVFISRENSRNTNNNSYGLHKWKNINSFLKEYGMNTDVVNKNKNWVSVVGVR